MQKNRTKMFLEVDTEQFSFSVQDKLEQSQSEFTI